MRIRTGLLAATLLLSAGASVADAAPKPKPKPVCNLVVDGEGDAIAVAGPSDDAVDIVSADVASDGKTITAVLRVKKLTNPNPASPFGQSYFLVFSAPGSKVDSLFMSVGLYPTGNQFIYGYQGVDPLLTINTSYTLGEGTGTIDAAKNEMRVSVPIDAFKEQADLKPGKKITALVAEGRKVFGQRVVPSQQVGPARAPLGGLTLTADTAEGKSYTLGTPSCVAVGK